MIKLLILVHALSQSATEQLEHAGVEGYKHGGFEAVAWVELGGLIVLGLAFGWREKQHRVDIAAKDKVIADKDTELRDLNKVTREVLISDSKAIEGITAVIVRHFK